MWPGASRDQVLQVVALPANRADEEEGASLTVGKYNEEMKFFDSIYYFYPDRKWKVSNENFKNVKIFYEILIIYAFFSTM